MILPTLSTILFSTLALTSPLALRQQSTNVTLVITSFSAFMADPYVEGAQSNLSFHLTDPRPEYHDEVDCVIPNTYFNLWGITALYEPCGDRAKGFQFLFGNGNVAVQRRWVDVSGKSFTASSSQNPHWTVGVNVTVTETGKLFVRKEPWLFPVSRIQGL